MSYQNPQLPRMSAEWAMVYSGLASGDDTVAALMGAELLNQCLYQLLLKYFVKGDTSSELLQYTIADFATRAKLAYSLGLIDKTTFKTLTVLMQVRNKFAHSIYPLTFGDKKAEAKLTAEEKFVREKMANLQHPAFIDADSETIRKKYEGIVMLLSQLIIADTSSTERRKRKPESAS